MTVVRNDRERHENAMRCVLNSLGECLAKIPEACQCRKMPEAVFMELHNRLTGAFRAVGESAREPKS